MNAGHWLAAGAIAAGIGVGLGAFAAHGLKARLSAEMLAIFETGVRYQLIHAIGLLAVAWAGDRWSCSWIAGAGWAFGIGIAVFSGSLYLLALTGTRWLGAITPLGGVAFLVGWALLAAAGVWGGSRPTP